MLFSVGDINALRLLRLCRYVSRSDITNVLSEGEMFHLERLKLLRVHTASETVFLSSRGEELLISIYPNLPTVAPLSYKPLDIIRRVRVAKIVLTAYSANLNIFTNNIEELTTSPSLFIPTINRGRGQNPWANTRIAAIVSFPDALCGVHYVGKDIGKVLLNDELSALSRNTATLPEKPQALIFAGESYADILSELNTDVPETNERLISYGEAYRKSPLPVHLLSCDDTGMTQLRIMAQPNYRQKLSQLALRGHFTPPPKGANYDAVYNGAPFLIAIDMDLRRIDIFCHSQKENGGTLPAIAALDKQVEEVLRERYKNRARVFTITTKTLSEFFGTTPPNPADQVFISPKGEPVHAPIIQTRRKN